MRELLKNVQSLPDVEIIQTPEDFKTAAERTLDSREKVICYAGSVELLIEAYEQAYEDDYYIPTRMQKKILVKMLAPPTDTMRKYQEGDEQEVRETRSLPEGITMDYSVMIHDDTVVFFARDEGLYGLSVVSPSIAQTMKAMFDVMWQTSKKQAGR